MGKNNDKPSALDRLIQEAMGTGKVLGYEGDPARTEYPQVWEWLARVYVGRDSIKQPATLALRLGPQGVLASLVDRDLCVSVDVTCRCLGDVLAGLEAALTGDSPPIKSWGRKEPHLRKRRAGG